MWLVDNLGGKFLADLWHCVCEKYRSLLKVSRIGLLHRNK
jgi:hypothetical protein